VGYNRDTDSAERFVADLSTKTRPHGASASAHQGNVGAPGDCRRTIGEVIDSLTKTLAKEAAYQLAKSGKNTDNGIGITVNTRPTSIRMRRKSSRPDTASLFASTTRGRRRCVRPRRQEPRLPEPSS
jgi:hypothetical protein